MKFLFSKPISGVKTFEFTRIIGAENIEFGTSIIIDDFTLIHARARLRIGSYVHIACFASITGGAEVTLGDFSAISQGCRILTGTDDFKSAGFGNSTVPEEFRNTTRVPIYIGNVRVRERDREAVLRTYNRFLETRPTAAHGAQPGSSAGAAGKSSLQ